MREILRLAQRIMSPFKSFLEVIFKTECFFSRCWASSAHHRLMLVQWGLRPQPEHFDHHIDLFYNWLKTRNPLWVERGVFSNLSMVLGGDVLELACGDGFNARNFYSLRARRVVACDFDHKAIKTARQKNAAPNVEFRLSDIRTSMPEGKYDNVIWDAAIEHFTQEEINGILNAIKMRLKPKGILAGHTICEKKDGKKSLSHHEYEFKNKEDLLRLLRPHFKNVTVFETIYPDRHNLYFWASDNVLPFSQEWSSAIIQEC